LNVLKKEYGKKLFEILQKLNLVPYGNHARGAKFDGSHWITPEPKQLTKCACKFRFYFGRLDVMYNTIEE
jgi:hypothetical protein